MNHDSSTQSWNQVGQDFCELAQTNDFRMYYIMPYTLYKLGDVSDKKILDLGCGEGGYSRELSKRNANITSVDCSEYFIEYAVKKAIEGGLSIQHLVRNSNDLYEVNDDSFDIVLCSMMLMDCEDLDGTIKEINRVLKPSGKLFISILHPCFNGKYIRWEGEDVEKRVVVENYFYPREWMKPLSKGMETSVIWRHRTLEDYVKVFIKSGLTIVDLNEPIPTPEQVEHSPRVAWLSKVPMFLFWELVKYQ